MTRPGFSDEVISAAKKVQRYDLYLRHTVTLEVLEVYDFQTFSWGVKNVLVTTGSRGSFILDSSGSRSSYFALTSLPLFESEPASIHK